MTPRRPRHNEDQVERVLNEAEGHGWDITYKNAKFTCRCACGGHAHTVRQGSHSFRTAKNLRSQLMKCWH
jgi:hypothetical protein